jgi:hypothetical protein
MKSRSKIAHYCDPPDTIFVFYINFIGAEAICFLTCIIHVFNLVQMQDARPADVDVYFKGIAGQ